MDHKDRECAGRKFRIGDVDQCIDEDSHVDILEARKPQIHEKGAEPFAMACEKQSLAGSVSQRACVFCGSRVVLYPIADAVHLVHGPIGCAAYTWDIRGALSSGPELHRLSFSTDLRERDVIYGGEKKLYAALVRADRPLPAQGRVRLFHLHRRPDRRRRGRGLPPRRRPRRASPCCRSTREGFRGTKKDGYRAACDGLAQLVGTGPTDGIGPTSINILGDFNLAGETWMIRDYYERIGVEVVATITGDGRVDAIRRAHGAELNVVQCSGSMIHLAQLDAGEVRHSLPPRLLLRHRGHGQVAVRRGRALRRRGHSPSARQELVRDEVAAIMPELRRYRQALEGRRAAVYTGGAFKAFSLVRSLRTLGMKTVLVGSQTGNREDYELLRELVRRGHDPRRRHQPAGAFPFRPGEGGRTCSSAA